MAGIIQSGAVTPNHLCSWVADGIIGDGGVSPTAQQVIASIRGANFNTTTDQPIVIPQSFVAFQLTSIIVTNASQALSSAVGGFYPQPSKGGTQIVSQAQTYAALTGQTSLLNPTLTASVATTRYSSANLGQIGGLLAIWFSLTTPQGLLATADIFVIGVNLT